MNQQRLDKILGRLSEDGLTQMIISDPIAIFYLTGKNIDPWERLFALYIHKNGETILFNNELYYFSEDIGAEIVWLKDTDDAIARLAARVDRTADIGIDKNFPARFLLRLMELNPRVRYINSSACVDRVRAQKDEEEQKKMRNASLLNDICMERFAGSLHEGMTEREAAAIVNTIHQELGADGSSFSPLIGFGANAADAHHEPDDTRLRRGDCILTDIGCQKDGYCSDMTRTFFFGEAPQKHRVVYEAVRRANEAAESAVRPGVRFCDLDQIAREIITQAGFGERFTHRLGHSIGIEPHEFGDVSANNTDIVEAGMTFSIEPGIYLQDEMGVRIEDLILVTENGCEILNHYTKELTII